MNLIAVFLGGGLGSICRYGVEKLSSTIIGSNFPYATLCSNVLSTLVLAYFIYFFTIRWVLVIHGSCLKLLVFVVDLAPSLPLVLKLLRC